MKGSITFVIPLVIFSTNIGATKSRMEALGQDSLKGSPYIDDTRNVFANPADIGMHTDYAVFEWGGEEGDNTDRPTPEGGFFRDAGNFTYGLYLGAERASSASHLEEKFNDINDKIEGINPIAGNGITPYGNGHNPIVSKSNTIDLFFGGDMGTQWGTRIHYASANDKDASDGPVEGKHNALILGVGIIHGDLEIYTNYTLSDDYDGFRGPEDPPLSRKNATLKNDGTMDVGVSYHFMQWTLFGHYDKRGSAYTQDGQNEQTYSQTIMKAGAGYTRQISSMARFFSDISYVKNDAEAVMASHRTDSANSTSFPITIGFEADATSWLTLRGSIKQSLFGNNTIKADNKNYERSDHTTDVAAGATLNFGKLKVDGMIGVNDSNAEENGVLSHTTLTKVAVHYWF